MGSRIRRLLQAIGVMAISFAIFSTPSVALADDTFMEYDGNGTELSLSFMPADSDEAMATSDNSRTSSTTGVTIGTGFLAARQVSVDQTDVYNKALTRVKY